MLEEAICESACRGMSTQSCGGRLFEVASIRAASKIAQAFLEKICETQSQRSKRAKRSLAFQDRRRDTR